jgi:hypothetical protein
VNNVFVAGARPAIVVQGSSLNVVRSNEACGTPGPFVREQAGLFDDGRRAEPTRNRIDDNVVNERCRA